MSLEQIEAARTKFLERGMSHGELLAFFTAARTEIESLKHDLSRHLSITSEQATEILGKEKEIGELRNGLIEARRYLREWAPSKALKLEALNKTVCAALSIQLRGK